jgi:hypothetical protein
MAPQKVWRSPHGLLDTLGGGGTVLLVQRDDAPLSPVLQPLEPTQDVPYL